MVFGQSDFEPMDLNDRSRGESIWQNGWGPIIWLLYADKSGTSGVGAETAAATLEMDLAKLNQWGETNDAERYELWNHVDNIVTNAIEGYNNKSDLDKSVKKMREEMDARIAFSKVDISKGSLLLANKKGGDDDKKKSVLGATRTMTDQEKANLVQGGSPDLLGGIGGAGVLLGTLKQLKASNRMLDVEVY